LTIFLKLDTNLNNSQFDAAIVELAQSQL